jgi:hypothetical protein
MLTMQSLPDQIGQHPHRSKQRNQRTLAPHLDQVRVHQRTPRRLYVGLHDRRHLVRHVVDRKELVDQRRATHAALGSAI